jgi:hypothetical protein
MWMSIIIVCWIFTWRAERLERHTIGNLERRKPLDGTRWKSDEWMLAAIRGPPCFAFHGVVFSATPNFAVFTGVRRANPTTHPFFSTHSFLYTLFYHEDRRAPLLLPRGIRHCGSHRGP